MTVIYGSIPPPQGLPRPIQQKLLRLGRHGQRPTEMLRKLTPGLPPPQSRHRRNTCSNRYGCASQGTFDSHGTSDRVPDTYRSFWSTSCLPLRYPLPSPVRTRWGFLRALRWFLVRCQASSPSRTASGTRSANGDRLPTSSGHHRGATDASCPVFRGHQPVAALPRQTTPPQAASRPSRRPSSRDPSRPSAELACCWPRSRRPLDRRTTAGRRAPQVPLPLDERPRGHAARSRRRRYR